MEHKLTFRNGPLAMVLLLTAIAYCGALRYGFVYDDGPQIVGNPLVQSWSHVGGYFTQHVWANQPGTRPTYYRPLFLLWLRLQHALFGLQPAGWHAASILLHLLVTWQVFLLGRALTPQRADAAFAALIFGLHPIHVEVVAWVSGSTDLLAAAFMLASLLAYLRVRSNARRRLAWSAASVAWYALALFSKEIALVLPLMLVAFELLPPSASARVPSLSALLARLHAYLWVTAGYLLLRSIALGGLAVRASNSLATVLHILPEAFWLYLRHLVWPFRLSPFYSVVNQATLPSFVVPLLAIAVVAALALTLGRRLPVQRFTLALLLLPLLPPLAALRFLPDDALVHDRYLYLPSIGFALLAGVLLSRVVGRAVAFNMPAAKWALMLPVMAILMFGTIKQQAYWANDLALYQRAIQVAPNNPMVLNGLADAFLAHGDRTKTIALYQQSLALDPDRWSTNFGVGMAYFRMKDYVQADRYLSRAVTIEPTKPYQGFALGLARRRLGHLPEAEAALRQALQVWPRARDFHLELGEVLEQEGKLTEARDEFSRELEIDPASKAAAKKAAVEQRIREKPASTSVSKRKVLPHIQR